MTSHFFGRRNCNGFCDKEKNVHNENKGSGQNMSNFERPPFSIVGQKCQPAINTYHGHPFVPSCNVGHSDRARMDPKAFEELRSKYYHFNLVCFFQFAFYLLCFTLDLTNNINASSTVKWKRFSCRDVV